MRRKGIAIVGCAAVLILGVGVAGASATELMQLTANGEVLPVGAPVLGTSANMQLAFSAKAGNVKCTNASFAGSVAINHKIKKASVLIAETAFSGGFPENEERCSGGFLTTATVSGGLALIDTGVAELKGVEFELVPINPHGDEGRCKVKALAVKGNFPVSHTEPVPVTITFTKQLLRIVANSGHECGLGAYISMTLEMSSSGGQLFSQIVP